MRENRTKSALLVIDMENGFVEADSPHCIAYAKASVPAYYWMLCPQRGEKDSSFFFCEKDLSTRWE